MCIMAVRDLYLLYAAELINSYVLRGLVRGCLSLLVVCSSPLKFVVVCLAQ